MPALVPTAVAAGLYTDIVRIDAPDSAVQGENVDVTVKVKNIDTTFYHWVACVAKVDGLRFIDQDAFLAPGETHSYSGAFLMAGGGVTITAYSYYWYYDEYIPDDEDEKDVALEVAWQKLATKTITINPITIPWQKLATKIITITPKLEWVKLASETITIIPKLEWVKLATKTITLTPTEVEWVKLATKTITLSPVVIPPEYKQVYHHEYPLAKTYAGKAEECTARFRVNLPDQFYPSGWVSERMVSAFAEQVEEQGGRILDVKVYEDTTPTWHTDYIMVVTAVTSPFPWVLVIGGVLAIILIIAFTNLVVEVKDIDWGEIVPKVFPILAVVLGIAAAVTVVAVVATKKKEIRR